MVCIMAKQEKRVVIGTDHGGLELKDRIRRYLESTGYQVEDCGVFSDTSVDYPDTSEKVCREFLQQPYEFGVVVCGTGVGASMAANKVPGIRCALIHDLYTAEMAKAHNNANILSFGGRVTYSTPVEEMIDKFIETDFQGGRHSRRVNKLAALDKKAKT